MRRIPTFLMLFLAWCAAVAQGDDVILRVAAKPTEAWVGQRVILELDVLGADGWAQISKLGELQVPGAYLLRTDSQGTRLQETIDGAAYTGQRYELSVYPQKAGPLTVPPFPVEVTVKTWGADASESVRQRQTPELVIDARLPPGAEGIRDLISTSRLIATQQWSSEKVTPRIGDALKRTITRQADDVSGMALVPLAYPDLPGVGLYPAEPRVADSSGRGSLTGQRAEEVTYVFERAGTVRIPDIELRWWNVPAGRLETVTLPGRELEVLPGPASGSEAPPGTGRAGGSRNLWPSVATLLAAAVLMWRLAPWIIRRWQAWEQHRRESEARYFRKALASIGSGNARGALRDVMRWLDRINEGEAPAQLQPFVHRFGGDRALVEIGRLLRSVAEDLPLENPRELAAVIRQMRSNRRRASRLQGDVSRTLPELNGG